MRETETETERQRDMKVTRRITLWEMKAETECRVVWRVASYEWQSVQQRYQ